MPKMPQIFKPGHEEPSPDRLLSPRGTNSVVLPAGLFASPCPLMLQIAVSSVLRVDNAAPGTKSTLSELSWSILGTTGNLEWNDENPERPLIPDSSLRSLIPQGAA